MTGLHPSKVASLSRSILSVCGEVNKSDGITSDSSESESMIMSPINWSYVSVHLGVVAGAERRFAASFLQLLQSFCPGVRLNSAARSLSTGLKEPR